MMSIILTLFPFWIGPAIFLGVCLTLLFKPGSNWKRAGLYGLSAFGLSLLFGTYSIFQSRSSTAGIGFLFLPLIGLVPGGFGFLLGKFHRDYLLGRQNDKSVTMQGIGMALASLLVIAPFIWQAKGLKDTVSKNNVRDLERVQQKRAIKKNFDDLANVLSQNPGQELAILRELVRDAKDRTQLIPIAANRFTSPDLLDALSKSDKMSVVLRVVKNRNTSSATLERVYKDHQYPFYFFVALSKNPNTPEHVLRELYDNRLKNGGIAHQMARNPKLPSDLLDKLSIEPNKYVLRNILDRPDISCRLVNKVIVTIGQLNDRNTGWLTDKAGKRASSCAQP